MDRARYSRWVDPAPLEVERPRLPWWTLLPRKFLLLVSPVLLVVVLGVAVVFVARRVWRYPLFLLTTAVLVGLGVGWSWWASLGALLGLGAGAGVWAEAHRVSFDRAVVRQVRSEWRRAVVYALRWRRVMLFCDLTKRTDHGLHPGERTPSLAAGPRRRPRCTAWSVTCCARPSPASSTTPTSPPARSATSSGTPKSA